MSHKPRDAFDPDNQPRHWVDEEGNFAGWMTPEEEELYYQQLWEMAEAMDEGPPPECTPEEIAEAEKLPPF